MSYFELPEHDLGDIVERTILTDIPQPDQPVLRERVLSVVYTYEGNDISALTVLMYAVQQGKLDAYLSKLEEYHRRTLAYIHPETRRNFHTTGAQKAQVFFLNCLRELGVRPNEYIPNL
ncbi:hypothetical protein HZB00_02330 [Candidatus Woesearchaeota archaeon]|nr:hypothetical protein [Candidatus Woesearchaeota archaeon]